LLKRGMVFREVRKSPRYSAGGSIASASSSSTQDPERPLKQLRS
jgi:hypothetical protein